MTECLKCGKKLLLLADYLMSNFPKMYEYWKKDFEKFIFLLRKGEMCYEYNASWDKCNGISLPLKEKLFSRLKYLMETTSMYKGYTVHTA